MTFTMPAPNADGEYPDLVTIQGKRITEVALYGSGKSMFIYGVCDDIKICWNTLGQYEDGYVNGKDIAGVWVEPAPTHTFTMPAPNADGEYPDLRTRDNERVTNVRYEHGGMFPIKGTMWGCGEGTWTVFGDFYADGGTSNYDLVGVWEEPSAGKSLVEKPAAETATEEEIVDVLIHALGVIAAVNKPNRVIQKLDAAFEQKLSAVTLEDWVGLLGGYAQTALDKATAMVKLPSPKQAAPAAPATTKNKWIRDYEAWAKLRVGESCMTVYNGKGDYVKHRFVEKGWRPNDKWIVDREAFMKLSDSQIHQTMRDSYGYYVAHQLKESKPDIIVDLNAWMQLPRNGAYHTLLNGGLQYTGHFFTDANYKPGKAWITDKKAYLDVSYTKIAEVLNDSYGNYIAHKLKEDK